MSKPKGIGLALLLYSEDHNDLLPPRDTWMDVLTSAPSAAESVERSRQPLDPEPSRPTAVRFWCPYAPDRPSGGFGYAMNSSLDGRRLTTIPSARTFPLVYDSINYSRNASDPFL
ncbi:MAG TPA: hypothetical protein VEX38_02465, partial [Fimbriimonadaceae bacterium]|nr:hypothetical protein [Fimbriimonadaceae bacterium]